MKTEVFMDSEVVWVVRFWLLETCSQMENRVFAKGWQEAVEKALALIADGVEYKVLSVGQDLSD